MLRFLLCLSVLQLFSNTSWGAERPNILWFVVDDMSANFSCYGEKNITTPHVDRLAREGMQFTHAFVTAPVCSPCRSALITGMYQTSIGAHHHRSGRGELRIHLPQNVQPLPQLLKAAGYYTCIGTGLLENVAQKKKREGLGKTDYNFEYNPQMYDSHDWQGRKPNQPFFMQVQLAGGKLRGGSEQSAIALSKKAEEKFGTAVDAEKVILPPYYPPHAIMQRDWAAYLDSCRLTDAHVGQVLERLTSEGILDNTLIVFMTDHGISHARGKQFLYNEGTHIPFVVRGPSIPQGIVRNDLIEHIDLAAMTLAAGQISIPANMQGRNVLAEDYTFREYVFAARDRCDETIERIRSVRDKEYLYIRNFFPQRPHLQPNAYKDGKSIVKILRDLHAKQELSDLSEKLLFATPRPVEELYLWQTDGYQIHNLASIEEHRPALERLRKRLDQWMTETNDQGFESVERYDSDMKVYVGKGNPEVEKNIQLMKQWAAEGK